MLNNSSYDSEPGQGNGEDKVIFDVYSNSIKVSPTKSAHPRKLRRRVVLGIVIGVCALIAVLITVILSVFLPKSGK